MGLCSLLVGMFPHNHPDVLLAILCCGEATQLSEYQLMLGLPQAKLVAHQHQGLLYR
jgi:hypothetical protein